jgi:hypothetical protein
MQLAPRTDLRPAIDCDMRNKTGPLPDGDVLADHTKGTHDDVGGQLRVGVDNCTCMNLHTHLQINVIGRLSFVTGPYSLTVDE